MSVFEEGIMGIPEPLRKVKAALWVKSYSPERPTVDLTGPPRYPRMTVEPL